jgi:hypothetical protein
MRIDQGDGCSFADVLSSGYNLPTPRKGDDLDMESLPQAPPLSLPNRLSFQDPSSITKFLEGRLGTRKYCPIFNVPPLVKPLLCALVKRQVDQAAFENSRNS